MFERVLVLAVLAPTLLQLVVGNGECAGEACQSHSHCRSKWGFCGTSGAHCNSESIWTAACAVHHTTVALATSSSTTSTKTSGFLSTTMRAATTTTSTIGTTQSAVGSCTGSPCHESSQCRSEWGWCGSSDAHCNAGSTWTPACHDHIMSTTASTMFLSTGTSTTTATIPETPAATTSIASGLLCTGSGWSVHWATGSPPECLDWKEIGDVWKQASGNPTLACDAVVLAPGEAEPCSSGQGVKVHSIGHRPDPASGEFALGIWQALPSWYRKDGEFALNAFPDIPADFASHLGTDPCKQAYITERIRDAHCFKPWDQDGPIEGAPNFCNSGWTGNLLPSRGGATPAGQPPYYTNNDKYKAMVEANGLITCQ